MSRTPIRQLLFAAILATAVLSVRAEPVADDAGEKLVRDFLTDVTTLQGRFRQSLVDAEGAVVEASSGTLEIERPSRFRWIYDDPYEQWLVADGTNVWSYDVDLAQVSVKPQSAALANTPAMLLGDAANALAQFRFEGSQVEGATTWVRMRPADDSSGFERVELGFRDGELYRMAFFDNLEQTTLVEFQDTAINQPIDASRFVFVVPEDADLVGVPLAADATAQ
ncbi:MAG: outer membrane lipoprotein chaperone LolA [Woeseiaceae bacterium]|nr:outer membrane lipoprotein chaperone LolA [Woeseiaceae bacterium]